MELDNKSIVQLPNWLITRILWLSTVAAMNQDGKSSLHTKKSYPLQVLSFRLISKNACLEVRNKIPIRLSPSNSGQGPPFGIAEFHRFNSYFRVITTLALGSTHSSCVAALVPLVESSPSDFAALQCVDLYHLSPDTAWDFACQVLKHCPSLTDLHLLGCSLYPASFVAEPMGRHLANSQLRLLNISHNNQINENENRKRRQLKETKENNNNNNNDSNNNSNSNSNNFLTPPLDTTFGADFFAVLPATLEILDVSACFFSAPSMRNLCQSSVGRNLRSLLLSYNYIDVESLQSLSAAMGREDMMIEHLFLDYCTIRTGLLTLGQQLISNRKLKFLALEYNGIQQQVGEEFIQQLDQSYSTKNGQPIMITSEMNNWNLRNKVYKQLDNQVLNNEIFELRYRISNRNFI